jgi:hypothetical protein
VGDFLEISQVAVQQGRPNGKEVGVTRVVHLHHTPRVLAGANLPAANVHHVLGADNGERHQAAKFGVLLHRVLVILLDVVGEVVNWDSVMLNVLHDKLLRLGKLLGGQGVGAANYRNDIDTGGKALHQLNVELT